ncbi:X-Pro dipeptidyl-peptidase [Siphonobacter sp. SORGH_AS_0500]|uniref:CocE/NonD family hydrolase n=1 Tax=Siphonobacter sp. SORGH_AS_0500 TaxID=1864824 RepID=UPI000CA8BE52|nr:CocE/NonD family hydrolase [Siphonobacter sp. SORGH_AS_0500]PKK38376.1 X-Pro dipeptidyl-peptidase [Siphonobacter sp. SORGH_AS_0500]
MKEIRYLLLFLVPLFTQAQNADSTWFRNNYTKLEQYIPMRDGTKLFTSIYLPKDKSEKHPILMTRTPYSCAPYGSDVYRPFYVNHYKTYLKEGYIMVIQDVRGRWMSEGVFEDIRPYNPAKKGKSDVDEASDTYDTIDWMVKNLPDNNGKVGVFGISYPGFYSTMAALSNHPALKAASPQAPVTDWFLGDDFHHNGAFMLMDAFNFYVARGFGAPRPKPTTVGPRGFALPTKDSYDFFLRTGALPNFTKMAGDSVRFWNDLMTHPNMTKWWTDRNVRNFVGNISPNIATLVVGGLFDAEDCFGAWTTYSAIESKAKNNNKIIMGPWFHGQWAGRGSDGSSLGNVQFGSPTSTYYAENVEIPFFNYYLKGKGSVDKLNEATIFFTGENQWKTFETWPPKAVTETPLYLQSNGGLSFSKPQSTKEFTEYVSDPAKPVPYAEGVKTARTREYMTDDQRFAAIRPDVLVFETEVLTDDVTLSGTLTADLQVSLSSTDADFVVKLIDVFPDDFEYSESDSYIMNGYQMLVRGEIMRGRFRKSFEKPEAFVPNQVTQVKYDLPDVAHTFKKGHKIMVQIQSSWFPLADRNPQKFVDIYQAKDSDFQKANIKVFHNASAASKILLPVLKK